MFEAGRRSGAGPRVWVLRHGRSTYNGEQRYQGSSDASELTAQGRDEARRAGQEMAAVKPAAIYTSPLRRAAETAREAAAAMGGGVEVIGDTLLEEISLFGWEGRKFVEVCETEPEAYGNWRHAPEQFGLEDGRGRRRFPVVEAFERARRFLAGARAWRGDVLVTTHNGMGRALILAALGLGPEHFHAIELHNGGLSAIDLSGEDGARLRMMNSTGHLGMALPKVKGDKTGLRLVLAAPGAAWMEGTRMKCGRESVRSLIARLREPGLRPMETVVAEGSEAELSELLAALPDVPEGLARGCRVEATGVTALHFAGPNSRGVLQMLNGAALRGGARMEPAA